MQKNFSLKEAYKNLLNEDINFSTKTATVYHLTGLKNTVLNWGESPKNREIDPNDRAKNILQKLKKAEDQNYQDEKYSMDIKRKTYNIAIKILKGMYSLGTSFSPGSGDMYGIGLYTCYKLNPKIAKTYGDVILRFEVDLTNFMIFNAGIAKQIHGENWRLEDQFLSIIKRKSLDSIFSFDTLESFLDYLKRIGSEALFLNSTYEAEQRTAPFALETLKNFSIFSNNEVLLREIVDGLIFYGNNDGPVCLIYRPEDSGTYSFTGAGYFTSKEKDSEEYEIFDDIENLVGKEGKNLAVSREIALENDLDSVDQENKAKDSVRKKLNRMNKSNKMPDFITRNVIPKLKEKIIPEYLTYTMDKQNLQELKNFTDYINQTLFISIYFKTFTMQPIIDLVNEFGPGIDKVTSSELIILTQFLAYCRLKKSLSYTDSYQKMIEEYELDLNYNESRDKQKMDMILENLEKVVEVIENPSLLLSIIPKDETYASLNMLDIKVQPAESFKSQTAQINAEISNELNRSLKDENEISLTISQINDNLSVTSNYFSRNLFGDAATNTINIENIMEDQAKGFHASIIYANRLISKYATISPGIKKLTLQPTLTVNTDTNQLLKILNNKYRGYYKMNDSTPDEITENIFTQINTQEFPFFSIEDIKEIIIQHFIKEGFIESIEKRITAAVFDHRKIKI